MEDSDKEVESFKSWYEKKSGTTITGEEAREAAENLLRYVEVLARLAARRQGDLNLQHNDNTEVRESKDPD